MCAFHIIYIYLLHTKLRWCFWSCQ